MALKKDYCIIGLNGFSLEIARQLQISGAKVVILDNNQEKVDNWSTTFEYIFKGDATVLTTLEDITVDQFSAVIVGVSDMETSILIVSNLNQLRVKNIIVKVESEIQRKVLTMIAGNNIQTIWPDESVAENLSFRLVHNLFWRENNDSGVSIIDIPLQQANMAGKTVANLIEMTSHCADIVYILRDGDILFPVNDDTELLIGDILTVACRSNSINEVMIRLVGQD